VAESLTGERPAEEGRLESDPDRENLARKEPLRFFHDGS
jgi:hypothetical protein